MIEINDLVSASIGPKRSVTIYDLREKTWQECGKLAEKFRNPVEAIFADGTRQTYKLQLVLKFWNDFMISAGRIVVGRDRDTKIMTKVGGR